MTYTNIKNMRERGFTIVELVIVIVVIAILATLVYVTYSNVINNSRDTKRQSDTNTIREAADNFKGTSIAGTYPDLSSGSNFQTMINNASLYNNSTKTVTVPTSTTDNLSTTAPSASAMNNIQATYCPSGATYTTATGVTFTYWSQAKNGPQTQTTGTGC